MKTQFITHAMAKKITVILPIKDYDKMIDD